MGAVPEIKVPTVQPEAMPVVAEPEPQLGAFAGAHVGKGLSADAEAVFGIGWDAYHKAATAFAQQQETAFQKRALDLRDEFRRKQRLDAVGAHREYLAKMEQARREEGAKIKSKDALAVYENNSLRNMRLVQESIDQHFEQEERSYRKFSYDQRQEAAATMVGVLANNDPYPKNDIAEEIGKAKQRARDYLAGASEEDKEIYASNELHKITHALFRQLLDPRSTRDSELVRSELAHYADLKMVDPVIERESLHALNGKAINEWVGQQMSNFVRVSHLKDPVTGAHVPDPRGYVPYEDVQARIQNGISPTDSDAVRKEKTEKLIAAWEKMTTAYHRAGDEMENDVVTNKVVGDKSSLDWHDFSALYGTRADMLADRMRQRTYREVQHQRLDAKVASQVAYGATRLYLDGLSTEDAKKTTEATVLALMRQNYHGDDLNKMDPMESAHAVEHLKKLQTGKLDALERRFHAIAVDALMESYKGNKTKVAGAMNHAYYFLEQTYSDAVRGKKQITEADLRSALKQKADKKGGIAGWFGGEREIESYEGPPEIGAIRDKNGDWWMPTGDLKNPYRRARGGR